VKGHDAIRNVSGVVLSRDYAGSGLSILDELQRKWFETFRNKFVKVKYGVPSIETPAADLLVDIFRVLGNTEENGTAKALQLIEENLKTLPEL